MLVFDKSAPQPIQNPLMIFMPLFKIKNYLHFLAFIQVLVIILKQEEALVDMFL